MLTGLYITLRFGHFISLMLAFWLRAVWRLVGAGTTETRADAALFIHYCALLLIGAISTLALYLLQGGIMGEGWTDVWRPAVWQAVAGTRFGGVWIWQILLAWIALAVVWIRPPSRRPPAGGPAGGTAAAFRRGRARRYARWSHRRAAADKPRCASLLRRQLVRRSVALYLLPAPGAGALAAGRGLYHGALFTLRASGRRRHDCQRSAQCAVDPGRIDWRIAVGTHVVDQMCAGRRDGGNCVSEQVCSGTAHVGKAVRRRKA